MTHIVGEVKQYVLGKCPKYKVKLPQTRPDQTRGRAALCIWGISPTHIASLPQQLVSFPQQFCFISPTILLHFPNNLLHFPNNMVHFPNNMSHFPKPFSHFPNNFVSVCPLNKSEFFLRKCPIFKMR